MPSLALCCYLKIYPSIDALETVADKEEKSAAYTLVGGTTSFGVDARRAAPGKHEKSAAVQKRGDESVIGRTNLSMERMLHTGPDPFQINKAHC